MEDSFVWLRRKKSMENEVGIMSLLNKTKTKSTTFFFGLKIVHGHFFFFFFSFLFLKRAQAKGSNMMKNKRTMKMEELFFFF